MLMSNEMRNFLSKNIYLRKIHIKARRNTDKKLFLKPTINNKNKKVKKLAKTNKKFSTKGKKVFVFGFSE